MAPISDFSIASILAGTTNIRNAQSPDEERRPEVTYSALIFMAIRGSPRKLLTLNEICSWIETNFSYYRHNKDSWQNSVRHTLSVNHNFVKVPRPMDDPGRGSYWALHPYAEALTVGESTGRLRNPDGMMRGDMHRHDSSFGSWCPPQLYDPGTKTWYTPTVEEVEWANFYSG